MGFFDKIKDGTKDATGIGLSAEEQYARAYHKGVFLQPPDYSSAAKQFASAAEKFMRDGNQDRSKRAAANSALYGLLCKCDLASLSKAIQTLEKTPEIEEIGSQKDMVPTSALVTELTALQHELAVESVSAAADKAENYAKAAHYMMQLGRSSLHVAERLQVSGPTDVAMMRGFYYMALADYYTGLSVVAKSPSEAHDFLQKATAGFQQVKAAQWVEKATTYLEHVKSKRHCWVCGREMQGRDIFYAYYPASIETYHHHLVETLNQDIGMLDCPDSVTLCTVCGSAIERQADRYATLRANELRHWVTPILENHNDRLQWLEKQAHTHH